MKKILTLISSLIFISPLIAQAQNVYPSGVSGCVARWTFDSEKGGALAAISDESGNIIMA